jgi:chemotaxis protein MotB
MAAHARRRKGHEEEHENHERWLITYGDMLTLLMVLFIVLFAMGQVDEKKYAALKEGLSVGFDNTSAQASKPRPAKTELDHGPQGVAAPGVNKPTPPKTTQRSADASAAYAAAMEAYQQDERDQQVADATAEADQFAKLRAKIEAALAQRGMQGSVKFDVTERGLVITIVANDVVFGGDSAVLRPAGARILDAIAPPLRTADNRISVEGHTNHLLTAWSDSWQLSTARAVTVVRYLNEDQHLPAGRLQATGFGKQRPLYPIGDPRAITLNRRVEVVVLSNLSTEAKALLPAAAAAHR